MSNIRDPKKSPELLVTPLRFGVVQPNLYRGSYPRPHNLRYLKRLRLRSILSITPLPLRDDIKQFAQENGITLIHIECAGYASKSKKKRNVPVPYSVARRSVEYMINNNHSPMYVHCLNGSQVAGLTVACLRKLSFWSMAAISDEFLRYSEMESADQLFIENFRSEIEVPQSAVPWMWKGLSKCGVVQHHPTLKIKNGEEDNEEANQSTNNE